MHRQEPNSAPEPPEEHPDLGMAIGDLDYRSFDEVVHPGREEQTDDESASESSEEVHDTS